MLSVSVILITRNEAANIRACLESVAWADEIIVVDSGSTDETAAIARSMGARVYEHDWPGFGPQKNRALGYATKEWVFSIDADERVTPELRAELEQAMHEGRADGYYCPRLSQFCGTFVRHSGWYPDYVLRLFKRDAGRFSDSLVHYSYLTMKDVERKVEHYSTAAAQQMHQAGKQSDWGGAAMSAGWAFVRTFIIRKGILDGMVGWQIACMNARTTWLKYRKLALLASQ